MFSYHPQQQQPPLQQMMQHPQQVHHLIPSSNVTSTGNRDHHHHHQPPPQQQQHTHQPKEMNKPKGRMSAYTFFVQKCRDEHRKAYPNENANFSEFSKKCAEKWKVSECSHNDPKGRSSSARRSEHDQESRTHTGCLSRIRTPIIRVRPPSHNRINQKIINLLAYN